MYVCVVFFDEDEEEEPPFLDDEPELVWEGIADVVRMILVEGSCQDVLERLGEA